MSSVLHPVGPEEKGTYWRRRLALFVGFVVVVVLVVLGVRALSSDDAAAEPAHKIDPSQVASSVPPTTASPSGSPTDTATGTATDSPTDSASTTAAAGSCAMSALELTLTSDATTYGPGRNPKFVLTVQNTSGSTCSVEVGSGARTFEVTSAAGSQVWSSADCQTSGASDDYDLEPGAKRSMTGTWSRLTSASGCPTAQTAVADGNYTVTATWKGETTDPLTVALSG